MSPSGPRGGLRRTRCWDPVGGEERISESALDTYGLGRRPGVTASMTAGPAQGVRKCSGGPRAWRCFRCPKPSSQARGGSCHLRHVPENRAHQTRPPAEGCGVQELPTRCCQSLLSRTACGLSYSVGTGACGYSFLVLTLRPWGPWAERQLRLPLRPTSGTGPGLLLPTFKLRMLTAASPPLCASLSPPEVSRGAQPPQWSESPLPLRTVGGRQGLEPGGVYAQGPSLT